MDINYFGQFNLLGKLSVCIRLMGLLFLKEQYFYHVDAHPSESFSSAFPSFTQGSSWFNLIIICTLIFFRFFRKEVVITVTFSVLRGCGNSHEP